MSNYLAWNKKTITDFSTVTSEFDNGFVFTREELGSMYQTRSLRINLANFTPNSENRRILNKVTGLTVSEISLPMQNYDWHIHKLGKDYYDTKFGPDVFSANKIKELLTTNSNFNTLLEYRFNSELVGYAITFKNADIMQYAYPFYDLTKFANNFGMGMMLNAINIAKSSGCKYIYLGSVSRPADTYKLQFSGLEWFDGKIWQSDLEALKPLIESI